MDNLESRLLISKELLERRLKRLYKVGLRHLKLLLLFWLSLSFQPLQYSYTINFSVVSVIFSGIEGLNALIVLVIKFLYIIIILG
jgi:hypothetical protein